MAGLPTGHLGFLIPPKQKWHNLQTGVIGPGYQGGNWLSYSKVRARTRVWNPEDFSGGSPGTFMSNIKANEKLNQQKIKSTFLEDLESLEMKIWVISPSKRI